MSNPRNHLIDLLRAAFRDLVAGGYSRLDALVEFRQALGEALQNVIADEAREQDRLARTCGLGPARGWEERR